MWRLDCACNLMASATKSDTPFRLRCAVDRIYCRCATDRRQAGLLRPPARIKSLQRSAIPLLPAGRRSQACPRSAGDRQRCYRATHCLQTGPPRPPARIKAKRRPAGPHGLWPESQACSAALSRFCPQGVGARLARDLPGTGSDATGHPLSANRTSPASGQNQSKTSASRTPRSMARIKSLQRSAIPLLPAGRRSEACPRSAGDRQRCYRGPIVCKPGPHGLRPESKQNVGQPDPTVYGQNQKLAAQRYPASARRA